MCDMTRSYVGMMDYASVFTTARIDDVALPLLVHDQLSHLHIINSVIQFSRTLSSITNELYHLSRANQQCGKSPTLSSKCHELYHLSRTNRRWRGATSPATWSTFLSTHHQLCELIVTNCIICHERIIDVANHQLSHSNVTNSIIYHERIDDVALPLLVHDQLSHLHITNSLV